MIPLMLDLHNAAVLIFGTGRVATRKAQHFKDCRITSVSRSTGTDVSVISDKELEELIASNDIIIAALSDAAQNERICNIADKCGKLYNSATAKGNFLIPASFEEGGVSVSVSTGGKAPALAACIRDDIKKRYSSLEELANRQQRLRETLKKTEPDAEKRREEIRTAAKLGLVDTNGINIALASFDYSSHNQDALASCRFEEEEFFQRENFAGAVLLQTCNRVEILTHGTVPELEEFLADENRRDFRIYENGDALLHLSRLAAGIESLIVGEDQILGQLRSALLLAERHAASDMVTSACIETAIQLGARVRQQTSINRGAVSIGSAAVQLAENICRDLSGKNILVVGGGEMGKLVTKALSEKNLRAIYVTNRTYENALKLAEEVNGRAMHMDQLYTCIGLSDVVISCTSAPHEIIRAEPLQEIMETRLWPLDDEPRPLILIDIANPPDVEKACSEIPGVKLFTIDDLAEISEQNMSARRDECRYAEEIIKEFQPEFIRTVRRIAGHNVLAELYLWAEEIRSREADHALQALEHGKPPEEVIQRLTKSLTKKLMDDASAGIRRAAEEQSLDKAEKIVRTITRGQ